MATCCFTGHRPDKLGGYNYNTPKNLKIKEKIKDECINLIENFNVDTFVCGGALGFDQMAFEVFYNLKKIYPNLKLIVAIPFEKQDCKWIKSSIDYYRNQLTQADELVYVDTLKEYSIFGYTEGIYYPAKMQKRNEYMVDISDYIITFFDGTNGGTKNCINYWNKKKKNNPINIFFN